MSDTICALSSAPGRAGLAVVRVSGPKSLHIHRKIFRPKKSIKNPSPRLVMLGNVVHPESENLLDEANAVFYMAPKSYTGEDMTEYSIHGSPVLIAALLKSICSLGARLAEPGEFTMRAFLHGKMDLTQAEAVKDIIESTTLFQAQVAARQRSGEFSKKMEPYKKQITDIIVQLESAVEFVEDDLPLVTRETTIHKLEVIIKEIRKWIETFHVGKVVREGFRMAVIGRPNVGKSSLFNALLNQDRSIVMDMPGTTRDFISENTGIGGIPVQLMDTAGIPSFGNSAEELGIQKTYQVISDADAILLVLDRNRLPCEEDFKIRSDLTNLVCIVVMNKNDLVSMWSKEQIVTFAGEWPWIEVSAKFGTGIDRLRSLIFEKIFGAGHLQQEDVLITNLRHRECLEELEREMVQAASGMKDGLSEEFPLIHLHRALKNIGSMTGETYVENILTEIFSRFCIGK